jgi:hypothetical protein
MLCRTCQYYYITWDKHFPYGCKQLGFKAAIEPAVVVWQTTGQRCPAFIKKSPKEV